MKHVICPACKSICIKYGKNRSGSQRWFCKECSIVVTPTIEHSSRNFKTFLEWLFSKKTQKEMPGEGRTFRRKTSSFWNIWPMPPKIEEPRDVVYVDGIYIARKQKHGKRFILKGAIAILVAVIVIFAGVCYADVHESFISYENSGISVSDGGDLFTGRNFRRLVCFRFTEESDNGEQYQTVFLFLTSNIFTRLFNSNHDDKTPFVGYGEVDGRALGSDGKLHDAIVTEVYYLPEEYADDNSLLNSKHSQLVPISASEQEAKAAIEQMKADSVLLWVRK